MCAFAIVISGLGTYVRTLELYFFRANKKYVLLILNILNLVKTSYAEIRKL